MNIYNKVDRLVCYSIDVKLDKVKQGNKVYSHMGGTITDAILQAGLNYNFVVYPRVRKLVRDFPDYTTTCDFLVLMQIKPLEELIQWKDKEKLRRIKALTYLLYSHEVENEFQLLNWLNFPQNIDLLMSMRGIGPKTIDYLKLLSGGQSIAVDRHLFSFLDLAGVYIKTYEEANLIYKMAAEQLGYALKDFDKMVWNYMSNIRETKG